MRKWISGSTNEIYKPILRNSSSLTRMSLQDKRACLWHAFCALDDQKTGAVLKSKLKVLTHNIANCLGVQKVEDRLAEFNELDTINFTDYCKFFHTELATQFSDPSEINSNVDLDKIDEVCWFVTHAKTFMHRQVAVLSDDDLYRLWRVFNFLAERDEGGGVEFPVVIDAEEVELLLQKFHSSCGTKFNTSEFEMIRKEISSFNVAQVVNLVEEHHCKGADAEAMSNAIQEMYDELLVEVIKKGYLNKKGNSKMTAWKERWFVLTPRFIYYYTSRDEMDRKGSICVCDIRRVEILTEKGSTKMSRFQIVCNGRTYEINANDHRTRTEWITAIKSVLPADGQHAKSTAKEARDRRREARNARKKKEEEEEERKKSEQMSFEKTRLELEAEREARSMAEARAKSEEEKRLEEAKKSLEMLDAEKKARQEWEAQMHDEASQLKAAIAERECLQSQQQLRAFQMLETEKQAREELEARLREQALLREAEHQRLCELEELQTKLQALLEEERQAKRDEEIVRAAQARVLNEEMEKREELERMRDQLESVLQNEQQKREQLELISKEQEELLRKGQQRMEELSESEKQREIQLQNERIHLEELIQCKEQQESVLRAEQKKLENLESEKADVASQYEEALRKLQEAEKAREELKAQMKKKEFEVHVVPPINRLISPEAKPLVTHRGQGAFVDADFSREKSVDCE